jgi:hypothetical protein
MHMMARGPHGPSGGRTKAIRANSVAPAAPRAASGPRTPLLELRPSLIQGAALLRRGAPQLRRAPRLLAGPAPLHEKAPGALKLHPSQLRCVLS